MASVLKVDQIQLPDGSAPTASDLGVSLPSADMPAGSVINVVRHEYSGGGITVSVGAGSTLWQPPSYTPISSTSKIIFVSSLQITGDCDVDGQTVYGYLRYFTGIGGTESTAYSSATNALVARGGHSRTTPTNGTVEVTNHGGQDVHFRAHFESSSSSNRNTLCMYEVFAPSTVVIYEIAQ